MDIKLIEQLQETDIFQPISRVESKRRGKEADAVRQRTTHAQFVQQPLTFQSLAYLSNLIYEVSPDILVSDGAFATELISELCTLKPSYTRAEARQVIGSYLRVCRSTNADYRTKEIHRLQEEWRQRHERPNGH